MFGRSIGCQFSSSGRAGELRVLSPGAGLPPFNSEPLVAGTYCLFRAQSGASGVSLEACPVRLGRILRIADEVESSPFVVMEPYWPLLRPQKYGDKVNLFGSWMRGLEPCKDGERPTKRSRSTDLPGFMVAVANVLVWPVDVEESKQPGGLRVPLSAFKWLRRRGVDLAKPCFTFAKRGKECYFDVCHEIAEELHESR